MPSPQEVEDWKTKLEQQKGSARKKSDDLRKKIEELRGAQEEAESADAEAKALQLQLDEARLLAAKASEKRAEAKKAKGEIDGIMARAKEAEEEHRRIAREIEAMPSREELLKRVGLSPFPRRLLHSGEVENPFHFIPTFHPRQQAGCRLPPVADWT